MRKSNQLMDLIFDQTCHKAARKKYSCLSSGVALVVLLLVLTTEGIHL